MNILEVENLHKTFLMKSKGVITENHAVNQVSFSIAKGEVFGLVGESGSGKTTIANIIMQLESSDSGVIRFEGREMTTFPYGDVQIVFQDPRSSLDPRMSIRKIIAEPTQRLDADRRRELSSEDRLIEIVKSVGLRPEHLDRKPHEFSGGQRQRIAIARALITQPKLVVLDEPTSALDISVQAQVINLLKKLQQDLGLTYLFISHNMGVVKYLCDRIGVLNKGVLVEVGKNEEIFTSPKDDYTQRLLASVPTMERKIS